MREPEIKEIKEGKEIKCPYCGRDIGPTEIVGRQPSCEHLRFIYLNGEAFEYIDPELEKELDAGEKRAEERGQDFDMWDALKAHTGPDSMIIEQNEDGCACGAVQFTVWIGIRSAKRRQGRSASVKHGVDANGRRSRARKAPANTRTE
jgi:hypothetical protein